MEHLTMKKSLESKTQHQQSVMIEVVELARRCLSRELLSLTARLYGDES